MWNFAIHRHDRLDAGAERHHQVGDIRIAVVGCSGCDLGQGIGGAGASPNFQVDILGGKETLLDSRKRRLVVPRRDPVELQNHVIAGAGGRCPQYAQKDQEKRLHTAMHTNWARLDHVSLNLMLTTRFRARRCALFARVKTPIRAEQPLCQLEILAVSLSR